MQTSSTQQEAPSLVVEPGLITAKPAQAWEQTAEVFDLTPMRTAASTNIFVSRTWTSQACLFAQQHFDSHVHRHTEKHIQQSGGFVSVHRYLDGAMMGETAGEPLAMMPGRIIIRDYGVPFEGVMLPSIIQVLLIPHKTLGFRSGAHPAQIFFDAETTLGRVIHRQFDDFFAGLLSGQKTIDLRDFQQFLSCVKLAINRGNVDRDVRARVRHALGGVIKDFVEKHLRSPDLKASTLLKEFGVSRATLFRIFEPYGGVRSYISKRRMGRAIFQIAQAYSTRGQISQASSDWGFSSDANFNRAVHRHFGSPPSALFWQPLQKNGAREFPRSRLQVLLSILSS